MSEADTDSDPDFWTMLSLSTACRDSHQARRVAVLVLDAQHFSIKRGARVEVQRRILEHELAANGWRIRELAEPQRAEVDSAMTSKARLAALELGLSPWPSASGWAPMDLPWTERRILIGIVMGVADLARWAHQIWLRDAPLRQIVANALAAAEWDAVHPYCNTPTGCGDLDCNYCAAAFAPSSGTGVIH